MKICNFRLYSESEANRILWGIRSDLFSVQNGVGFGWYRVTRGSPKLVLAAITRSNFRPKKPCNFKLALILELVLCIKSFEEFNTSLLRFTIRSIPLGTWFLSCFLRDISFRSYKNFGSISVSGQLPTYPSPNPTLTLTCRQLTEKFQW